jgi:hypothetical protein
MLRFRSFLTPIGGAFLIIAVVILIRSLLARNAYEIILSSAALVFLLVTGVIGYWRAKKNALFEPGWKPPFPMVSGAGDKWQITGMDVKIPLFFRLHFAVRGRFYPNGNGGSVKDSGAFCDAFSDGCPVLAEISVARGEKTAQFPLDFPISGVFRGEGSCRLRDIFGFFSFSFGITQSRTVKVRSSPSFGKKMTINAQSGAEDKKNKTSSDEERYYMREYTPGDRFRDINWKSSEKIDALITRISPDNQEKVTRIEVFFRNFGNVNKPSLEALWLLDRSKAWLSLFLYSLMNENSSYIFEIHTAQGNYEIEDSEDLDNFLEELAALSFSPPQNDFQVETQGKAAGDMYVFSTACDAGLNGFLLACNPRPVTLFMIQQTDTEPEYMTETLRKRNFPLNGIVPLPRWLKRNKIKRMGIASGGKVLMFFAETKI